MWKNFSRDDLAHTPTAVRTMALSALAASFFLALLCGLFYNAWAYEVDRVLREEGSWQARLTLTDGAQAETLEQFAQVDTVTPNEGLSGPDALVVELTFRDRTAVYDTLGLIRDRLGLDDDQIQTHDTLLSLYGVTDPDHPALLLPFLAGVLALLVAALVLLLRNAFEITMQARLHRLGILASVGATPRQLRLCLLQEAAAVSLLPLAVGTLLGFAACRGVLAAVNQVAAGLPDRQPAVFTLHPAVAAAALLAALVTVLLSAWLPARRLCRIPPLEAMRGTLPPQARGKGKRSLTTRLLARCFGIRGELAGSALQAQKKSLRIANLSLLLSFLGFTAILCFFTLSGISTDMTYFARYQDAWDVMATLPDTRLSNFSLTGELADISGVEDCLVYEKQQAAVLLPAEAQSDALQALGGLGALAGEEATVIQDGWLVEAPLVILDDTSFLRFCEEAGIAPSLDGAVLLNRIWDSQHSNFRNRQYLPFVQPDTTALTLADGDGTALGALPLLGLTDTPPNLREEYDQYTLVLFWPQSLWERWTQEHSLPTPAREPEVLVRLLGREGISQVECETLQKEVAALLEGAGYACTVENRLTERADNDRMIQGAEAILGAFCLLVAAVGLANVFLNTLGFVEQRRRAFARYLSLGMTPRELRSLFWMEGTVLALRPLVITIPLTAGMVALMLQASYLDPALFLAEAPVLPVALFALSILFFVALAYALGARRVLSADLTGLLKDDSLL